MVLNRIQFVHIHARIALVRLDFVLVLVEIFGFR